MKMKKILTAAALAFACTLFAAQKTENEMVLPLKVVNGRMPGWNGDGTLTALDGGKVQLQLKERTGKDYYQASAFYRVRKPQPGEYELVLELSTQSQGFFTILFYSPLYSKDGKVERRYEKLPLDEFDAEGAHELEQLRRLLQFRIHRHAIAAAAESIRVRRPGRPRHGMPDAILPFQERENVEQAHA